MLVLVLVLLLLLVRVFHDLHWTIAVPKFPDETHMPATVTVTPQMSYHLNRTGDPSISCAMEPSYFVVDERQTKTAV